MAIGNSPNLSQLKTKTMYKINRATPTTLKVNKSAQGETIEMFLRRVMKSGEPIKEVGQIVFYEEGVGVPFEVNVRTDRFDEALTTKDRATKEAIARKQPAQPVKGEGVADQKDEPAGSE